MKQGIIQVHITTSFQNQRFVQEDTVLMLDFNPWNVLLCWVKRTVNSEGFSAHRILSVFCVATDVLFPTLTLTNDTKMTYEHSYA